MCNGNAAILLKEQSPVHYLFLTFIKVPGFVLRSPADTFSSRARVMIPSISITVLLWILHEKNLSADSTPGQWGGSFEACSPSSPSYPPKELSCLWTGSFAAQFQHLTGDFIFKRPVSQVVYISGRKNAHKNICLGLISAEPHCQ